uniref:NADH-ubiquinone oxidoreductase chain 2 n=2 Tax=Gonodactylidae TaxID=75391 RepID=A0A8K1YX26_9CRUS|nr:NADH dehydrogenase subunit 2 [Gonodactylus smithii]QTK16231.1 NADH dehydrogenase subunit 2 [Gonodactylus smithii]UEV87001.1 NADH dehydrogenase subunit 2 [Gonodactylellus affinis]
MFLIPSHILFFSTLMFGMMMAASSSSWFTAWMGLELNLLSFIPLISSETNQFSSEASLKYFLTQALASAMILLASSAMVAGVLFHSYLLSVALLIKMGAAPFHMWFPMVAEGLGWLQFIILSTIQKIAPMTLLSYVIDSSYWLIMLVIPASALVGALGGINQLMLRKLMAYSSIGHTAWMLSALLISETLWLTYFLVYCLTSATIALFFFHKQAYHLNHLISTSFQNTTQNCIMYTSLLSLGGLPPFTGFIPKWITIQEISSSTYTFLAFFLILGTLINLYYYLRLTLNSFMMSSGMLKWQFLMENKTSMITTFMIFLNLTGLLMSPIVYMLTS